MIDFIRQSSRSLTVRRTRGAMPSRARCSGYDGRTMLLLYSVGRTSLPATARARIRYPAGL